MERGYAGEGAEGRRGEKERRLASAEMRAGRAGADGGRGDAGAEEVRSRTKNAFGFSLTRTNPARNQTFL